MKNILITGANFNNKGAQSMLFVAVDEIKKRFPDAKIYFGGIENWKNGVYSFDQVYYRDYTKAIAMNNWQGIDRCVRTVAKDMVKTILRKSAGFSHIFDLKRIIHSIDLIIDISGFNIGRQWDINTHEDFFDNIRLARAFQIPMILMPQSFGPFDYDANKRFLLNEAADLLPYLSQIFAREVKSKRALEETFGLINVELSTDMVLQNRAIDLHTIFVNPPVINVPHVLPGAVGIVPNSMCIVHGNEQEVLQLYQKIIRLLSASGKSVYIFKHSAGDGKLCSAIYAANKEFGNVRLISEDFSCFEYSAFVRQFDFIVCSRYHGIVNAYKNYIPAIVLGWAEKYTELAELLLQDQYQFDITETILVDEILLSIEHMIDGLTQERTVIQERMKKIQEHNCFDCVWSL